MVSTRNGPEPPAEVSRLARDRDLGELELGDEIVRPPLQPRRRRIAIASLAVGLVAATAVVIVRPDWSWPLLRVLHLAVLVSLVNVAVRARRRRRGLEPLYGGAWVFDHGIVGQFPGVPPVALRWDEVTTIRRRWGQVWIEGGAQVGIDRRWPRLDDVVGRVLEATTPRLASEVRRRIGRGEAVRFGTVLAQRDGLRSADRVLAWAEIDSVLTEGETLRIRARGETSDWAVVDVATTANTDVLRALAEPPGPAPSDGPSRPGRAVN